MDTNINTVEKVIGDLQKFKTEIYGRRPALLEPRDAEYLLGLLNLSDVDAILQNPSTRPPYLEMTRDGQAVREKIWTRRTEGMSVTIPDSVNLDVIATQFFKGATLVLNHLDNYRPNLKVLSDAFSGAFAGYTRIVGFVTPPMQQALGTHYDTFEGFIIQTHGTKTWHVYEQARPLSQKKKGFRDGEVRGEPILEVTLEPGDCLYVPWGSPHYATSNESISCHLTIMTMPMSWSELLGDVVSAAVPSQAFDDFPLLSSDCVAYLQQEGGKYLQQMLRALGALDLPTLLQDILSSQEDGGDSCTQKKGAIGADFDSHFC